MRHLVSILLLPFVVVVVVPWQLLHGDAITANGSPALEGLRLVAGAALFAAGLGLFAWCVSLFARVGRGTLAPWDPTERLVAVGPYRHVRNPMIAGVWLMLLGEAAFFRSSAVGLWALGFLLLNHVYFVLSEEPGLERRFGEAYRRYRVNVPRWIPRVRPWTDELPTPPAPPSPSPR